MLQEKAKQLKTLFDDKNHQFVVLYILGNIPDRKFLGKAFIAELLGLNVKQETRTGQILSALRQSGAVQNHVLFNYRLKQFDHDRFLISQYYHLLVSKDIVPEGWNAAHIGSPEKASELRRLTPIELRSEIGWLDDVEEKGMEKLTKFVETSVIPPVSLVGKSLTQSVYRINSRGLEKLKQYQMQLGEI